VPLINKGLANLGFGMWFIEAALPIVYHGSGGAAESHVTFDFVLHSGIGF